VARLMIATRRSRGHASLILLIWLLAASIGGSTAAGAEQTVTDQRTRLEQKMKRVQELVPQWVEAGGDQRQIAALGEQVSESLQAGDLAKAEERVDSILKILTASRAPTPAIRQGTHAAKLSRLRQLILGWLADGGNPATLQPLSEKLDRLLDSGTPAEVDAQIDRIFAVVSTPPSPEERAVLRRGTTPISIDVRPIPTTAALIFWSVRYDPGRKGPSLGPSELYTMDSLGGHVTQITFDHAEDYEHAAVSFDRKMIAADRYLRNGTGPVGVWVIDIERKTEVRVAADFFSAGDGGVDWSPDGFIYFAGRASATTGAGIFRIRPDGSGLTQVLGLEASDTGFVGDVSVSADGTMLAYVRAVGVPKGSRQVLKTQIWVAGVDGSGQRMVDDGGPELGNYGGFPVGDFDPELSPDNKFVVFSRTNTQFVNFKDSIRTAHDLWVAPVDRSKAARRITAPGPASIIPDWDDHKILFTEYDERGRYIGLVTINPDGTGKRRLEKLTKLWDGGRHGKWIPR